VSGQGISKSLGIFPVVFILLLKLSEPSLFLLLCDQNNHPTQSEKIALESVKSQGLFLAFVTGNPVKGEVHHVQFMLILDLI